MNARLSREEIERLAVEDTLRRAEAARRDPSAFFEFVMREEHTRAPLRTLPHQRVLFSFVMAHPRCVVRMPVGASKTYSMLGLSLWLIGDDVTARGAVISASAEQASKVIGAAASYIETSTELALVFPRVQPSPNPRDPWTQTKITVARPPGIRDATLWGVGAGGKLPGARLKWILVDDVVDGDNTSTAEQIRKLNRWFFSTVVTRADVHDSRIVVTNTPWDTGDLVHYLESAGWATLEMNVEGDVRVANADPRWDTDDLRPSTKPDPNLSRLSAHDSEEYAGEGAELVNGRWVDRRERVSIWPEKFSRAVIDELKAVTFKRDKRAYDQSYMMRARSNEDALCKLEWVEACKLKARERGVFGTVREYGGTDPVFTGVDLAFGTGSDSNDCALFTFRLRDDGLRQILDADFGKWSGPEVIERLIDHHRRYNTIFRVESNAAQIYLLQFARLKDATLPIKPHITGKQKWNREFGVMAIFTEIENGAWLIPNDPDGVCPEGVEKWVDNCLDFRRVSHTGDLLMASWFAREQARASGLIKRTSKAEGVGMSILTR